MKLIHTADIHLGAKIDSKFSRDISSKRKEELRSTFKRMVEYAQKNGVKAILLVGDVFDSDNPTMRDKEFFYSIVKNNPGIDFLYLKGNHDKATYAQEQLPNLKTFGDRWTYYNYNGLTIAGAENSNESTAALYSTLSLDPNGLNIVMMHGQIGDISRRDMINLKRLRDKNIDYLALGHIHKPQSGKIDDRGEYAYCGCLEGRGFDEIGEHGFILLETSNTITHRFIPFAERTISENAVDISGITDAYSAYLKIKERITFCKRDIYRINLVGEIDSQIDISTKDIATYLSRECYFADVKDRTSKKLDWERFSGDLSLKGQFVRTVLEKSDITEENKKRIVTIGMKALKGEDFEL